MQIYFSSLAEAIKYVLSPTFYCNQAKKLAKGQSTKQRVLRVKKRKEACNCKMPKTNAASEI
jgi:hypothetical protein